MLPELVTLIISYVNFEDFISDVITAKPPAFSHHYHEYPPNSSPAFQTLSFGNPFPEPILENGMPKEYCINMMPFIFGDHNTLPEECKRYKPQINICISHCMSEHGNVCYLTIDERFVKAGDSHRRGGLHVDTIGLKNGHGTYFSDPFQWGGAFGGLFIGSNIENSTMVYNYYISDDKIIGPLGSIEHLRSTLESKSNESLDRKIKLEKDQIAWITDRTPHESLPVEKDCFRQFFRIVTSDLTLWYSKHCTPSPFGILPGAKVVDFDKFK
jgi:hypothetical protein